MFVNFNLSGFANESSLQGKINAELCDAFPLISAKFEMFLEWLYRFPDFYFSKGCNILPLFFLTSAQLVLVPACSELSKLC